MPLSTCRECKKQISTEAHACPHCGAPWPGRADWKGWGVDWKSEAAFLGYPLIHVAFGRNAQGRLRVARGVIAIGQFAFGLITVAQFGVGLLFGLGQFIFGLTALAQFAIAVLFGVGQIATGYIAIGQVALGVYVLAQHGFGNFVWDQGSKHPEAVEFFRELAARVGWK